MSLIKSLPIKNPWFAVLVFFFFCLCIGLGCWQLARAQQKKQIIASFTNRIDQPALPATALLENKELRFYRVHLTGYFDNQHSLLLDNKTHQGQVGYELYTPFIAQGLPQSILIDRGFVPLGKTRRQLPVIPKENSHQLSGMLNLPPHHVALGKIIETPGITWPLRVQYLDLAKIATFLDSPIYPYVITPDVNGRAIRPTSQQIVNMGPERHTGYAFQWFALAITLLILFVLLNRDSETEK